MDYELRGVENRNSTNKSSCEILWKNLEELKRDDIFETARFHLGSHKWKLIVFRHFVPWDDSEYLMGYLLCTTSASIEGRYKFSIANIDPRKEILLSSSFAVTATKFKVPFRYMDLKALSNRGEGFLTEEGVKFRLTVSGVKRGPVIDPGILPGIEQMINVECVCDSSFGKRLKEGKFFGLVSSRRKRNFAIPGSMLIQQFEELLKYYDVWTCARHGKRGLSILTHLNSLHEGKRIEDFCAERDSFSPWLTIYVSQKKDGLSVEGGPNGLLIFCKELSFGQNTIEYIGRILVNEAKHSFNLFAKVAELTNRDFFEIYLEKTAGKFSKIKPYQSTAQSGLWSGAKIIVIPKQTERELPSEFVTQALGNLFRNTLEISDDEEEGSPGSDLRRLSIQSGSVPFTYLEEGKLCVICMNALRTATFIHGETGHKCACERCARNYSQKKGAACPLCRRRIQHTVYSIFA